MGDYLSDLVTKNSGEPAAIRPRPVSRFEPMRVQFDPGEIATEQLTSEQTGTETSEISLDVQTQRMGLPEQRLARQSSLNSSFSPGGDLSFEIDLPDSSLCLPELDAPAPASLTARSEPPRDIESGGTHISAAVKVAATVLNAPRGLEEIKQLEDKAPPPFRPAAPPFLAISESKPRPPLLTSETFRGKSENPRQQPPIVPGA